MSINNFKTAYSKKLSVYIFTVLVVVSFFFVSSEFISNTAYAEDDPSEITEIDGQPCAADEIIVKFSDTETEAENVSTLQSIDPEYVEIEELTAEDTAIVTIPDDKTLEECLDELNADSNIEYAQPNYFYTLSATVNDPGAGTDSDTDLQWYLDRINAYEAWDYATGAGVTVAVLDTGADLDHTDLVNKITSSTDVVDTLTDADDDNGHGTHVAGLIAAEANNSLGIAGVAFGSNLMIVDVFTYDSASASWGAYTTDIIEGINYAISNEADVINMSLGFSGEDTTLTNKVNDAVADGIVVVCAAGNDSVSSYYSPSDIDSAISVISTNYSNAKSSFSNYGSDKDISAPGEGDSTYAGILSTYAGDTYAYLQGTSMAAPIVSGVCALLLSENSALTVDDVKNILYSTATDLGTEGKDTTYGWGLVNAEAAVAAAFDVYEVALSQSTLEIEVGRTGSLSATLYPESATNQNVTWSSSNEAVATVSGGVVTGVAAGEAIITVTSEDGGYTDTCAVTVTEVSVTGVSLNVSSAEIVIGSSATLTATITPSDAKNQNVTWSTSDASVATVSDGVVTSVAVGTATITVTTEDGGYSAECAVEVIPIPVEGVSLDKTSTSVYVGASQQLTATVTPSNAANQNVTWSTSDSSIVTVDDGMITGVKSGTATVTVTTEDGSYAASCAVTVNAITPVTADDTMRVKLSIGSVTYIYFYIDGNYTIQGGDGTVLERQQYYIEIDGSTLKLYYGTSSTPIYSGSTIRLVQHEASDTGNNFVWIDNYEYGPCGYLGDIVFSISSGVIQAINHVYLEEYLYGVVPYEMSDSWPLEALKAQAIAARTYAVSQMGGTTYDVVDTSSDQVYKGYDSSKENAIAAVDATANIVLQYGDSLITAYYSASNGGYTDIPYHAWGSGYDMPYEITEDPYDVANEYSLEESIFFPSEITADNPVTVSSNADTTPSKSNAIAYIKKCILDSGQLSGVTSVDDFTLTGVLDLYAHTYDTDGSEDHSRIPSSGTNDCVDFVKATGTFTVSVSGTSYEVSGVVIDLRYLDAANGITTYQTFYKSALRLFVIEGDAETGFTIYHRRYGHGVGMSQRGAQARANDGQTYEEILAFYYPNTSRVTLSYSKTALTTVTVTTDNSNAVVVCNDYLNVRNGPSTSYSVVGTLPADARIEVTSEYVNDGDWHQINFGGSDFYVHSDYVTLDSFVAVTGVSLSSSAITLDKGDTQTLTATIAPTNATNKTVTWKSSDSSVATVSSGGLVTAVGGGTATITATTQNGSYTATCEVTVLSSVTGVTLDYTSITTYIGKTRTLTATVAPSDATDSSVTWASSNTSVATVSNGVVTAVSEGSATITVTTTDGGYKATCEVSVGTAPTDAIYSSVYTVDQTNSLLLGVPDEITIETMIEHLDNLPESIVVLDSTGTEITDYSGYAGTGMKLQLVSGGSVIDELDVVVYGDVSGDGLITITDYTKVRLDILGLKALEGAYAMAGDINLDSSITITDYTKIRLDILELSKIN